jgi:2-oxoglutarate ferredoxin oxidoreductase subunit gamma
MGGQGIIFSGILLARAISLYDYREGRPLNAIQTQSYGPAARGESSKCDVVISDEASFYPFVGRPDFLVVLSQPAYHRYIGDTATSTIVILEEDAIEDRPDLTYYEVPALRKASELGGKGAANMVMLGALVAISNLVDKEAISKAIQETSPVGAQEVNEKAYREGLLIGRAQLYQE